MQAHPAFSSFIDSYIDEQSIYGTSTKMPTLYSNPMGYLNQYQGHGVQIAQPEEECNFGNGGLWGLEPIMMEGTQKAYSEMYYSRPLSLDTAFEEPCFSSQSQFFTNSAINSAHPEMATYSNESSPFMNAYTLPSAPRTPVTPAITTPMLGGQYYAAPGMSGAFVLVPTDCEGNYTTVFYPREAMLDASMDDGFTMDLGAQPAYEDNTTYNMATQCTPDIHQSFDYIEDLQDDGPELVGMGLYDDTPELVYSNMSSPELTPLNTPDSGRGLVLEQSFGLPEEDDEDCEEDEYEGDEDEDSESQNMCY